MNLLLSAFIAISCVALALASPNELRGAWQSCRNQPADCINLCLAVQTGFMDKDGNVNADALAVMTNNHHMPAHYADTLRTCSGNIEGADPCAKARAYTDCIRNQIESNRKSRV